MERCRTTDTSFVENPPTSVKAASKFTTPAPMSSTISRTSATRGGSAIGRGRGAPARGARGGATASTRGTGVARGRARGSVR